MATVDFKSLPLVEKLGVTWSFYWRAFLAGLAATICSAVIGGIAGFFLGVVLAFWGFPIEIIQAVAALIGVVVGVVAGFCAFIGFTHVVLLFRLGKYRLVLVQDAAR